MDEMVQRLLPDMHLDGDNPPKPVVARPQSRNMNGELDKVWMGSTPVVARPHSRQTAKAAVAENESELPQSRRTIDRCRGAASIVSRRINHRCGEAAIFYVAEKISLV